jgi:chromosome segregation ATPase
MQERLIDSKREHALTIRQLRAQERATQLSTTEHAETQTQLRNERINHEHTNTTLSTQLDLLESQLTADTERQQAQCHNCPRLQATIDRLQLQLTQLQQQLIQLELEQSAAQITQKRSQQQVDEIESARRELECILHEDAERAKSKALQQEQDYRALAQELDHESQSLNYTISQLNLKLDAAQRETTTTSEALTRATRHAENLEATLAAEVHKHANTQQQLRQQAENASLQTGARTTSPADEQYGLLLL